MIAIKVRINGEYVTTAGQEDWSVLGADVVMTRRDDEGPSGGHIRYAVGGLSKRNPEGYKQHFRWTGRNLRVGDRIEFEIVETDEVSAPAKRYRSDQTVKESPFTEKENREMRYQDYLQLKKEFEPDVAN